MLAAAAAYPCPGAGFVFCWKMTLGPDAYWPAVLRNGMAP